MSEHSSRERRAKAAADAAHWLVAVQSEELSTQERADFIDWLRESPLHVSELLCACRLHRNLGAFSKWQDVAAVSDQDLRAVVELLPRHGRGESGEASVPRRGWLVRRPVLLGVAAGSVALAICAAVALAWLGPTTLQTQQGERREVTLSDGSVVDLAPFSKVRVCYRAHLRAIELDRGEALFHVAKNPERPFIVQAAGTRVRAVGTVFNVERGEQSVAVTVVEGSVTVSARQSNDQTGDGSRLGAGSNILLGADEQIVITAGGGATPVRRVKGEVEIAWAAGQLIFDNESVAEIARRFNTHNRTQIRVVDPQLAMRRISGVFRATDPDSFVAFVASAGGVSVERPDADQIVLGTPPTRTEISTGP